MKRLLISLFLIGSLSSCASPSQDGSDKSSGTSFTEKINASVASLNTALSGKRSDNKSGNEEPATGGRTHLRDTDLKDIIANSSSEKWPRIAVTVNKLPNWFYTLKPGGMPGGYTARDCINISITAWRDHKHSKSYDNIDFCGDDIVSNTPFKDVGLMWKGFSFVMGGVPNTGAKRTRGPLPPQRLFPNKPGHDSFFNTNGPYYLGSIMATVGYNWKQPHDYRFWVVNAPTQAETANQ